ncbi:MAG: hypothetical protein VCA74_03740 [Deltaproteobacteria bacterium]
MLFPASAFALCLLTVWRLTETPLFVPAVATVLVSGLSLAVVVVSNLSGRFVPPRPLTALGHVATALAVFLLFVSIAVRGA